MARTSHAVNGGTTGDLTPDVQLRSGGTALAAGDLVVVFLAGDLATGVNTDNGGFTQLRDEGVTSAWAKIFYKIAAGGETTWTPTTTATERWAAITVHYPAGEWHGTTPPEASTKVSGSSTAPDPPDFSPSWGSASNDWIAACFRDDSTAQTVSGWPTNYTDIQTESSSNASAGDVSVAARTLTAASENPGAFTLSATETWNAYTVAVRMAAVAAAKRRRLALGGVG